MPWPSDDDVRVVVLASEGKNFSAGADLGWMKRMAGVRLRSTTCGDARLLAGMLKALHDLPQPTIARVQGAAFGGAVGLVSCCDMAVAAAARELLPVGGQDRPDSGHHQPLCDPGHG